MSQGLLDALPYPSILIASSGHIDIANKAAKDLLGPLIVGRHHITALRQPMLLDAIERVAESGETVEAPYLTADAGRDITMVANCAPVRPGGGILVSFEDRTALREAGQIRRDFVANVSHELRTPLTALLGFVETLRGAAKDDPETRERFLETMHREASRMNRLVSDLLSLSRVEANERVRPSTAHDIAAIVRGVVGSLAPVARDAHVTLTLEGLDMICEVPCDPDQMAQVVTNLLENAIKYSGEGHSVTVSLTRDASHPMLRGDAVTVTVTDTGEGFDPIHIPRLTERFYRIDTHRSREMGGTGLGLAIVKHIVSRHRGRLRIESAPGKGSSFSVILPASV